MSANLIVGKDPAGNKVPIAVDAAGKIQIGGVQLDNLNVNTDQIEGKQDATNALLTTTAADVALTKGYANVTKGSGVVDSNTQRVTLATDGPGVANLTTIATNTTPLASLTSTSVSGKQGLDVNIIAGGGGGGSGGASAAYNATLPTYTSGASSTLQTDVNGKLITTPSVQLNSGIVTATTQRVTLATDGPEVTNSTAIKNSVANIPAKGAATTGNSTPVNIASDQIVPVRLATGTASIGYLTAPSTFSAGQQAVTATAAALPSGTLTNGVVLTNSSSAVVYIGNTGVTSSTGYALPVGASIGLTVAALSSVFIVGTASSGNLSYLGS